METNVLVRRDTQTGEHFATCEMGSLEFEGSGFTIFEALHDLADMMEVHLG